MRSYDNKKFIILQEDDKGYMFNNKKPSGYTKIQDKDLKFKIFYYIQNLNHDNTYNLNLIINKDSKIEVISIGEVKPDSNGKVEVSYDFDEELLDNICGSAVCLKDFKGEVKYPLSGFLPKKRIFNWKVYQFRSIRSRPFKKDNYILGKKEDISIVNSKSIESKNIEIKENKTINEGFKQENEQKDCESGNKDITSVIKTNETNILEENNEEELYRINKEEYYELENEYFRNRGIELMDVYSKLDLLEEPQNLMKNIYRNHEENVKKIIESNKENCIQAKHHIDSLKKLLSKDDGRIEKMIKGLLPGFNKKNRNLNDDYEYRFFLNILNDYEEINSLNDDRYTFFRVNVENFSCMRNMKKTDETKYAVVYYPMTFMYPYFKNKGYFIVGLDYDKEEDVSNLVYGIEVDKDMEDVFPYDGKMGFNKYIYDYEELRGYHIMEYDYKKFIIK